jgi:hypothetical protein
MAGCVRSLRRHRVTNAGQLQSVSWQIAPSQRPSSTRITTSPASLFRSRAEPFSPWLPGWASADLRGDVAAGANRAAFDWHRMPVVRLRHRDARRGRRAFIWRESNVRPLLFVAVAAAMCQSDARLRHSDAQSAPHRPRGHPRIAALRHVTSWRSVVCRNARAPSALKVRSQRRSSILQGRMNDADGHANTPQQ